jgi:hypothetical protein
MNDANDRRRFWRAVFHADVQLVVGAATLEAEVLDISLKGALVDLRGPWNARLGDGCRLTLNLGGDTIITMETVVAHIAGARIGLRCTDIDIDSITHLRRLVELNAGDPALLDRELAALVG